MVWDHDANYIWLIDLKTYEEWRTKVNARIDGGFMQYFTETNWVCWSGEKGNHCHLIYYDLKYLKKNDAEPII